MNKKILLGTILAVTLLTLVSFSNVVGYQSIDSDSKIGSPLFSIRNNKGDVSSDYLGKGNVRDILLPIRNNELENYCMIIDIISNLNDERFDSLSEWLIIRLNHNDKFDNYNDEDVIEQLNEIRLYPEIFKKQIEINFEENKQIISDEITVDTPFCIFIDYIAFLLFLIIQLPILLIIAGIYILITSYFDCFSFGFGYCLP